MKETVSFRLVLQATVYDYIKHKEGLTDKEMNEKGFYRGFI